MLTISEILRHYPPDCRSSRIEPLGSAGGMSGAQFWRITAPRGTLVLRRWPMEHPTPQRLRFIHAVLAHAAQRGVTILPLPVRAMTGESFIQHAGHLWELTSWLPGTADYVHSPSIERLRAAMTALAQFHIAVADFQIACDLRVAGETTNAVNRHIARLHELRDRGINDLSRAVSDATWPDLAPLARQFVATLPRAIPRAVAQLEPLANARLPLQPCIRDIWHDHVLFTGDEVSGVIDFGAVDIDTPATDIARLLGSLVQRTVPFSPGTTTDAPCDAGKKYEEAAQQERLPSVPRDAHTWREGLAAYSTLRPLSQQESLAVFALDTSGAILAGCNWLRWIYVEGRQFENRAQVVDRFRRLASRNA